jgi:peptide/nickel transport system permease protein
VSTAVEISPPERTTITRQPASFWAALVRGRGLAGTILAGAVIAAGVFAPLIAPYSPYQQIPGAVLRGPSWQHLLGTDEVGRDLFSRTLYGIRPDLLIVFVAVPAGAVLGSAAGLLGTLWSWSDVVIQRVLDLILAFPVIILGVALTVLLGPGVLTVAAAIVVAEIPVFGRLTRTSVLSVRERPYVEAALVIGAGRSWLLRRHVLPNSLEPLTVQLALSMSAAVFIEGGLSFLGLGVSQPEPSLGALIKDGADNLMYSPMYAVGPLVVVVALVLGLLLISQALAARQRPA